MARLAEDFPNDVRFVYRHFPLMSIHDKAALSAQAAEAAGLQGKFWQMHDLLFAGQQTWSAMTVEDFQAWLETQSATLKLDKEKFVKDLTSDALVKKAQDAWDNGQNIGLPGTPFLVINNQIWPDNLPKSYEVVATVVKLMLLEKRQFSTCPPMIIDAKKQYEAVIHLKTGAVTLKLYADKAPLTVNNFVYLARDGWYNGVTFHRVLPGFMAQAGDPSGTGYGGPGYGFSDEIDAAQSFDRPGLLAMANSGPNTNGSQFFITLAAATHLDGKHTIFGEVIDGMDLVEQITPRDPSQEGTLPDGDSILSIEIIEK